MRENGDRVFLTFNGVKKYYGTVVESNDKTFGIDYDPLPGSRPEKIRHYWQSTPDDMIEYAEEREET